MPPRRRLLAVRGALRERIATELRLGRSPVAIWSDLVAEDAPGRPRVETIYWAIYDGALGVRPSECLRSRRRRRRTYLGDQTRSTTPARASTGKTTRSSAPQRDVRSRPRMGQLEHPRRPLQHRRVVLRPHSPRQRGQIENLNR